MLAVVKDFDKSKAPEKQKMSPQSPSSLERRSWRLKENKDSKTNQTRGMKIMSWKSAHRSNIR